MAACAKSVFPSQGNESQLWLCTKGVVVEFILLNQSRSKKLPKQISLSFGKWVKRSNPTFVCFRTRTVPCHQRSLQTCLMCFPTCPGVQMSITQFARMNRDGSRIRDIFPSGRKSSEVQVTVIDVKLCLPLVAVFIYFFPPLFPPPPSLSGGSL